MQIEKPRWHAVPRYVSLRVDPNRIRRSPLGNELSVVIVADDTEHVVVVPTTALDEEAWTVSAVEVGEQEGLVIVSFPSTSMGTATLPMRRQVLKRLVVEARE